MNDAHQQRIRAAVAAFARGEIVIVADDDDRENEGDLFVAASLCTPEKMAFIIRHTSGIVCAPVGAGGGAAAASRSDGGAQRRAARHRLHRFGRRAPRPDHRHFRRGAHQHRARARQRQHAARPISCGPATSFRWSRKEGGVLMRSGHTEACVDLCRLAGLPPVGVLAELMNDDGTVMRGPEIAAFAERHKLQRVTIAELIAYRQARDKLIERVGEFPVESEIGTLTGYAFLTPFDPVYHMAFVHGHIGDGRNVLTRLHRANLIPDVFGGAKADPYDAGALQGRGQGRAGRSARRRRGRAGRRHSEIRRDRFRRSAHAAMARGRPRRANSQGSRRHLDPAAELVAPHDLCGPVRLRHRDRRHGAGRGVNRRAATAS